MLVSIVLAIPLYIIGLASALIGLGAAQGLQGEGFTRRGKNFLIASSVTCSTWSWATSLVTEHELAPLKAIGFFGIGLWILVIGIEGLAEADELRTLYFAPKRTWKQKAFGVFLVATFFLAFAAAGIWVLL